MTAAEQNLTVGTRLAIVRHGEAYCNLLESFIGGHVGCRGLTPLGVRQVEVLADRLSRTGEFAQGRRGRHEHLAARDTDDRDFDGRAQRHPVHLGVRALRAPSRRSRRYDVGRLRGPLPPRFAPGRRSASTAFAGRRELGRVLRPCRTEPVGCRTADFAGGFVVVVAHGGIIDASMIKFLQLPEHGTGCIPSTPRSPSGSTSGADGDSCVTTTPRTSICSVNPNCAGRRPTGCTQDRSPEDRRRDLP